MTFIQLNQYAGQFTNKPIPLDQSSPLRDLLTTHPGLRFIRLQWQDYSGLLRARLVVVQYLLALIATQKPVHIPPIGFHCIADNNLIPNLDPTGNHHLVPDWSSLRFLPSAAHPSATVMCGVLATGPARPLDLGLCPRRALANIVRHAAKSFDLHFQVGFEVEFEVFRRAPQADPLKGETLVPASTSLGRFAVDGLRASIAPLIEEAVHHLLDIGIGIQTMQTEGRRGQYELSLGPRAPLDAVDELVLVHDTLKRELEKHDLVVTMAPRPVAQRRQATGQHTHISVSKTELSSNFLAGILGRLPGICAVCLPFDISYERVQPYLGGDIVAWGTEDRTVPVRAIRSGHWEIRCVDATANMYLALATMLGAGMLGVENAETLRWMDTTVKMETYCREEQHKHKSNATSNGLSNGKSNVVRVNTTDGVTAEKAEPLPRSLDAALNMLEKDASELDHILDSSVLDHFLRVKRFEQSSLARKDPEEVRTMLTELF
ncbi:protein fluG [Penicillium fimorum]|uniref:Glutamine synthetase n=1 Tax=Penicillium fimorum TaxID=1882269 RepID=A0A9W9Y1N9_9EURO|nr:protein fluG [Penicillium fimorum]